MAAALADRKAVAGRNRDAEFCITGINWNSTYVKNKLGKCKQSFLQVTLAVRWQLDFEDAVTVFLDRFTEARQMLHQAVSSRHPDADVSIGTSPPHVRKTKLHGSACVLPHHLRGYYAFSGLRFSAMTTWAAGFMFCVVTLKTLSMFFGSVPLFTPAEDPCYAP